MDPPNFILWDLLGQLASRREAEVWACLFAGMLFAYKKSDATTRTGKWIETAVSGLAGFAMGMDAAEYGRVSPEVGTFLVTAVGYVFFDGVRTVLLDRTAVKNLIIKLLGGGMNGKG